MKVDILVGLQYGSEGKGKVCADIAEFYDGMMRVQSIQAGHTVVYDGKIFKMRQIPCGWVNPKCKLFIGAGGFIKMDVLMSEIEMLEKIGISVRERLFIDYRVTLVEERHGKAEQGLVKSIGSTGEGAGQSLCEKLMRSPDVARVENLIDDFEYYHLNVTDTIRMINNMNGRLLIEGAQGTLLSVHTSPYYPYVTSRECTVAGVLSETGLSLADVENVIGVMRTYPIRVGGHSGYTGGHEISWEEVSNRCGGNIAPEITTVTNRVRRIFEFSFWDIEYALMLNKPNIVCLNFPHYIDYKQKMSNEIIFSVSEWIHKFERRTGYRIDYVGLSEKIYDFYDRGIIKKLGGNK